MGNDMNGDSMQELSEVSIDDWVVVKGPAGSFLGKSPSFPRVSTGDSKEAWKKTLIDAVESGDVIQLNPAFEFITPLRPVPDPRDQRRQILTRDPILVSPDFVLSPIPVYIKAFLVYFLCDMQGNDAETYKSFVAQVTASSMKSRAANSGLVLPEIPYPKG